MYSTSGLPIERNSIEILFLNKTERKNRECVIMLYFFLLFLIEKEERLTKSDVIDAYMFISYVSIGNLIDLKVKINRN